MARPSHSARNSAGRFTHLGIRAHLTTEGSTAMTEVIATESTIVKDPYLGIERQVLSGQPVPPELIDAYHEKVGNDATKDDPAAAARDELAGQHGTGTSTGTAPTDTTPVSDTTAGDYESKSLEDLEALVKVRELEVEGTGSNGRVLKADLVAALKAADAN